MVFMWEMFCWKLNLCLGKRIVLFAPKKLSHRVIKSKPVGCQFEFLSCMSNIVSPTTSKIWLTRGNQARFFTHILFLYLARSRKKTEMHGQFFSRLGINFVCRVKLFFKVISDPPKGIRFLFKGLYLEISEEFHVGEAILTSYLGRKNKVLLWRLGMSYMFSDLKCRKRGAVKFCMYVSLLK